MSNWRKVRIGLSIISFIQGVLLAYFAQDTSFVTAPLFLQVVIIISPMVLSPIILLAIIGVQYKNPLQDKPWTKPNMDSNFLNFKDPLHFFHAAGIFAVACGLGHILGAAFNSWRTVTIGLGVLSGSLGIFIGVAMCVRVYRKKFQ